MITLALIGVGRWGKNFLTASKANSDVKIKYVCAQTKTSLSRLPGPYIATSNYTDLYQYKDIDGVIIATPSDSHYLIARHFLSRGYNLLIEKPLSTSYKQAIRLVELQKSTKSQVLIGHIYLYHPAYLKAKSMIEKIGQIQLANFEGLNTGKIGRGLSSLWEWGPQGVALMTDLFSRPPISVSAWGIKRGIKAKSYDGIQIRLRFSNKAFGLLKFGWQFPMKRRQLSILGPKGAIVADLARNSQLTYYSYLHSYSRVTKANKINIRVTHPKYSFKSPLAEELRAFAVSIRSKHPPITDINQGLMVTRVLSLAEKSLGKEGRSENFL